jgi:hypothetical protein
MAYNDACRYPAFPAVTFVPVFPVLRKAERATMAH